MKLARLNAKHIELNHKWDLGISGFTNTYDIAVSRLNESDWLNHLREKTWFSPLMEKQFLDLVKQVCSTAKYLTAQM